MKKLIIFLFLFISTSIMALDLDLDFKMYKLSCEILVNNESKTEHRIFYPTSAGDNIVKLILTDRTWEARDLVLFINRDFSPLTEIKMISSTKYFSLMKSMASYKNNILAVNYFYKFLTNLDDKEYSVRKVKLNSSKIAGKLNLNIKAIYHDVGRKVLYKNYKCIEI